MYDEMPTYNMQGLKINILLMQGIKYNNLKRKKITEKRDETRREKKYRFLILEKKNWK